MRNLIESLSPLGEVIFVAAIIRPNNRLYAMICLWKSAPPWSTFKPDMEELSLFPLNTVLFPAAPLALHIFEARYRALIQRCLMEETTFGVVLIRQGEEANGPLAEPYAVGCSAAITRVERLEDGRLNLLTTGAERFRIRRMVQTEPYLRAEVEWLTYEPAVPGELARQYRELWKALADYIDTILSDSAQAAIHFFRDYGLIQPSATFFLAAHLLEIPVFEKQQLLELPSMMDFASEVIRLYRRELFLHAASVKDKRRGAFGSEWKN